MLLKIYESNPDPVAIRKIVKVLEEGGLIIYPTDTVYGIGCDIYNKKAIERLCQIKGLTMKKAQFSFICADLSHLSKYTKSISTPLYRLLNSHLPGPFTFILPASKEVPKNIMARRSTVGIRVPDDSICHALLKEFGRPIISTSLIETEDLVYYTDPHFIHAKYEGLVDLIIDGGIGQMSSSTVVDCTSDEIEIIRQGEGILDL